jgi:putative ABC transport system substrate-binding protein
MTAIARRRLLAAFGGIVVWSLGAAGQHAEKLPTIGFLGQNTRLAQSQWTAAFVQRLRELGWIEGQTVAIEYRWAEGRSERYSEIVAELVRLNVDVIVTGGAPAVAAKQVTSVIPIVFPVDNDPVGVGLVASLARPGGNVTGLSNQASDLDAKRIELLREVVPRLRRLAIMANVGYQVAAQEMQEVEVTARRMGLDVAKSEIRRAEDIAPAFRLLEGHADALFVVTEPVAASNRIQIGALALNAHLPTMLGMREYVEAGGLMSYGPHYSDLYRRAADLVDKILRGTKPSDIPVEQPTKFYLVINLKIAKALGLAIPESFLLRADEVIE